MEKIIRISVTNHENKEIAISKQEYTIVSDTNIYHRTEFIDKWGENDKRNIRKESIGKISLDTYYFGINCSVFCFESDVENYEKEIIEKMKNQIINQLEFYDKLLSNLPTDEKSESNEEQVLSDEELQQLQQQYYHNIGMAVINKSKNK